MMRSCPWRNRSIDSVYLKKENKMMKHLNKYLSLALALVLCLSLAACGESNETMVMTAATTIYMAFRIPLRGW